MAARVGNDIPDFDQILISCLVASEVIYKENPLEALNSDEFNKFNHLIKSTVYSKVNDESNDPNSLRIKYMICECEKKLIVAIRGSHTREDYLLDLKLNGKMNDLQGSFHSGMFQRSQKMLIDFFIDKIMKENYTIVFTGHSLGAALAALVTVRVLYDPRIQHNDQNYHERILCIGFGAPAFADEEFKQYAERNYKKNFYFYVNSEDIVISLLTDVSNILYSQTLDGESIGWAISFLRFISDASNATDVSMQLNSINLLNLTFKLTKGIARSFVPSYKHFGQIIRLENNSLMKNIEANQTTILNNLQKYINDPNKLYKRIQNHYIANYRREFILANGICFRREALRVSEYTKLSLPTQIEKREDTCVIDKFGNHSETKRCNKYYIKLIKGEFSTEVNIVLCCENIDYIIGAILHLSSNENDRFAANLQKERSGAKTYAFSIFNSKLFNNRNEFTIGDNIKLELISHFMSRDYEISFTTKDLIISEIKFKEHKILNMQIDLLYLYAIFYCNTIRRMDEPDQNLIRKCEALESKLNKLSSLWEKEINDDQYKEDMLLGLFSSYFLEDNLNYDKMKEQRFKCTKVPCLSNCVTERDINDIIEKALYTCYYLKVLLSKSKSYLIEWDSTGNTGYLLNISNMVKNGGIFIKKLFTKINPDEGYLLVLKSFPLHDEYNNKSFKTWSGCYEEKIDEAFRLGRIKVTDENKHLLESIQINYGIRRILIGNDPDLKISIFGVVGRKKCGKSTLTEILTGADARASAIEGTEVTKPYNIINKPNHKCILMDYSHFDGTNLANKLQFLFSRYLLDHTFMVCKAEERMDADDSIVILKLLQSGDKTNYNVLVNKCDAFWDDCNKNLDRTRSQLEQRMQSLNKAKFEFKRLKTEVLKERIKSTDPETVLLTCLSNLDFDQYENDTSVIDKHDGLLRSEILLKDNLRSEIFKIIFRTLNIPPESINRPSLFVPHKIILIQNEKRNNNRLVVLTKDLVQSKKQLNGTYLNIFSSLQELSGAQTLLTQFEITKAEFRPTYNSEIITDFEKFFELEDKSFVIFEKTLSI